MKKQIKAEIIADSLCPRGHRLTTFVLTYPRFIHSELMTHRLFSKNSASSRAIPFEKMVKMVQEDPFIPIAWQKDHKGMQGSEYLTEFNSGLAQEKWLEARDNAVKIAKELNYGNLVGHPTHGGLNVSKQICNRLLEPFMWHTVILTCTELDNFFELRCPRYIDKSIPNNSTTVFNSKKDLMKAVTDNPNIKWKDDTIYWQSINKGQSEIHMMELAECMWDARNESIPKSLKEGEYHIPFGDNITDDIQIDKILESWIGDKTSWSPTPHNFENLKLKVATARVARVSYLNFEGKDDYQSDIKLYDTLLTSGHYSPFEHCARVMTELECVSKYYHVENGRCINNWCRNFRGFIQLRAIIEE